MKTHVVILEARGGTDKGPYGCRVDSQAIANSLRKRNWSSEIIFYSDEDRGEIYRHMVEKAGAYISRVNPGNLKDETHYFQMLRELVKQGIQGLPHPDAMINYGAKNAIEKLKGSDLVPPDVFSYYSIEELKQNFTKTLANGIRVLKQNRGSTGEGIWKVEVAKKNRNLNEDSISLDTKVKCTEARDNHVENMTLAEFIDFCVQYLEGPNGMILDMPYLERIKEGEIRVFMLRRTPVNIVHKKPAETKDAFSATLFSGAKYTYETPDKWPELMSIIEKNLHNIIDQLGGYEIPLIWTADFILDTDENGKDKYVLGEINASCVGFSTHLELSDNVAEEVIRLMEAEDLVNKKWAAYKY